MDGQSSIKLKPCPFCGGAAGSATTEQVEYRSFVARIECDDCEASFSTQYTEISEALAIHKVIAAWNKRPAPQTVKAPTEAELRAEFERQHAGRNLKQHNMRGTYIAANIAALWNQHKRTAAWLASN